MHGHAFGMLSCLRYPDERQGRVVSKEMEFLPFRGCARYTECPSIERIYIFHLLKNTHAMHMLGPILKCYMIYRYAQYDFPA
jgi:hypothetical protein